MRPLLVLVTLSVLIAGCTGPEAPAPNNDGGGTAPVTAKATATLHNVTATGVGSETRGMVFLNETNGTLTITILVNAPLIFSPLAAGEKGVHVHEGTSCAPGPASATNSTVVAAGAAGGHFNATGRPHGEHAGDLPNIAIDATGRGQLTVQESQMRANLTLGTGDLSIVGRALVVHAAADDAETQPSGNSGGRVLCGLIATVT